MAAVVEPMVPLDVDQRQWYREQRTAWTSTARVEDQKAAEARAHGAGVRVAAGQVRVALGEADAALRVQAYAGLKHESLLRRQRAQQSAALAGSAVGGLGSAYRSVAVRSTLERRDIAAAKTRARGHTAGLSQRAAPPAAQREPMFPSRESKGVQLERLRQLVDARVSAEATVEWALRAPLPSAEHWAPPRSYIVREGTDGDPFVWVAERKASGAPAMHNRKSKRERMSAEEKRDQREMVRTLKTRDFHRKSMVLY